jgi:putative effector of murein hydrolase
MTTAVIGSGALAYHRPGKLNHVFYAITTIYSYVFGTRIPRFFHPTIRRFLHPLIISFAWSCAILGVFGASQGQNLFPVLREYLVPGGPPMSAAGNHVLFWLEPSIITFAFGLYARRQLLFDNALPILAGAATSTFSGIFTMALLGRLFQASPLVRLALLPRATAALAVVQAGTIGANAPLTAVNCCYAGIYGANFGIFLLNGLNIVDPIARGVATGGGALALASAALSTLDPAAFPFGALGMSLTSSMATVAFCIPQFTSLVKCVAGL